MWTVVHFTNENSVEAVPSHWVKKDVCGWPKKNIKKHMHHRTIVNKYDFDYFPSRILKKGIGNYKLLTYLLDNFFFFFMSGYQLIFLFYCSQLS